jgi:diaminohydroxyphosphoribosylaminopyrimidine deaminase/5-amino-6-(5-phosphoribosylamino)uracil reductase
MGMNKTEASANLDILPQPVLRAFNQAIELARALEGATAPNPPVGCVLLDADGKVLSSGTHRRAGLSHAEADAIAQARAAGIADKIQTVVVTLEPCNHHGRTPPCAEAILATGAQYVWIACSDLNSQVKGGGAERLRAAGLAVKFLSDLDHPSALSVCADAERLLAPFSKRNLTGLPFITTKQAMSSSGSMLPAAGHRTFTSSASLDLAHRLRRRADAILTGSGTILADDPLFTVRRVPDHPDKQRMLVILDRRRRVSADYLYAAGQRGFAVHLADNVHHAFEMIGAAGGMEVLVEAGPTLTDHLLAAGLWDEHVLIEQAANPDGSDRVTVGHNCARHLNSYGKENDVLGHH